MNNPLPEPGHVYLVGAGPGDPGLLSAKGANYLAHADLVLYDEILDERLLDMAGEQCEKIFVGKRGARPSLRQEEINELLVANAGQAGVRLWLRPAWRPVWYGARYSPGLGLL